MTENSDPARTPESADGAEVPRALPNDQAPDAARESGSDAAGVGTSGEGGEPSGVEVVWQEAASEPSESNRGEEGQVAAASRDEPFGESSPSDQRATEPVVSAGSKEPADTTATPAEEETLAQRVAALRGGLDERIADLQRVTAEYANYRKRVDRDRTLVAEQATGAVLTALLPILDDLDRAREHGDLVGPFGSVAERLTAALAKFGLTAFGAKGDPFDPNRHEAVAHLTSPEVTEPSCFDVMRRGYLLGDRLLRAAMVAVADPE